ncbi:MAG: hypothetical protein ACI9IP_000130 [Arcticibacterium sp.]|jgi:hypothetical protein
MKQILLLSFVLLLFKSADAAFPVCIPSDTTILEFSDKSLQKKVTVIATGNKEIELPISINLNSILKKLGLDSAEIENTKMAIVSPDNKEDTLFIVSKSGQRLQIVSKKESTFKNHIDVTSIDSTKKESQSLTINQKPLKNKFFSKKDFGLYFGLNSYQGEGNENPSAQTALRTWKSRYIALSFRWNATLINGQDADLALSYGPELAMYNFRLENSNTLFNASGQTTFEQAAFNTKKSKLTIPYLNFPVLFSLGIKESKFKIGIGGYIGYRIGAYTKTKDLNGNKQKIKNAYNLNKPIYGMTAELGKKNGFSIFMRYDLNKMFGANQVFINDLQAFSFGIRL